MKPVTLNNATNSQMSDIRAIERLCKCSLNEAVEIYNKSFEINPYDLEEDENEPEIFGPDDDYVPRKN